MLGVGVRRGRHGLGPLKSIIIRRRVPPGPRASSARGLRRARPGRPDWLGAARRPPPASPLGGLAEGVSPFHFSSVHTPARGCFPSSDQQKKKKETENERRRASEAPSAPQISRAARCPAVSPLADAPAGLSDSGPPGSEVGPRRRFWALGALRAAFSIPPQGQGRGGSGKGPQGCRWKLGPGTERKRGRKAGRPRRQL